MPTNLYGWNDNFDLETSHVLPALLRKMHLGKCLEVNNWDGIRKDLNKNPIEKVKRWRYPQVILHGEVPDALEYLKPFSVVIVPLLSGSGMRVKIIESMALGKCIITSSIGAEGIPVQPNENIFIANNSTEWKKTLENLLQNAILAPTVGKKARAFVMEHYEWSHLIQKMQNFYQQFKIKENA
jgi:glycosyltransferase involved in cell wall biosynthesis